MALARTARCMPSDAAKSAATALPRPAVIPSAQSSLRQVTPPLGSHAHPQIPRSTPPIVMSAPHAGTSAAGHTSWQHPSYQAAATPAAAAASRGQHQQASGAHAMHAGGNPHSSAGGAGKDRASAFGSPCMPVQQPNQQHHHSMGSHGVTSHSQYSQYRPSGMTVTSVGPGMHMQSMTPSSTPAVASSPPGSHPRSAAGPPMSRMGHSQAQADRAFAQPKQDGSGRHGLRSHPGSDHKAGPVQQQGFRAPGDGPGGTTQHAGAPQAASSYRQQQAQQQQQHNISMQQQAPSPLGMGTPLAQQHRSQTPSPLSHHGPNGSSRSDPYGGHLPSWHPQQQQGAGFSNGSNPPSGLHGSTQQGLRLMDQHALPATYESKLPRGLAYGTSTWAP